MSTRTARALATAYFILYALAVIWPGYLPFNRIEPEVLGLPFSMIWPTLWLVGAALVLLGLDRVEARERSEGRSVGSSAGRSGPEGS